MSAAESALCRLSLPDCRVLWLGVLSPTQLADFQRSTGLTLELAPRVERSVGELLKSGAFRELSRARTDIVAARRTLLLANDERVCTYVGTVDLWHAFLEARAQLTEEARENAHDAHIAAGGTFEDDVSSSSSSGDESSSSSSGSYSSSSSSSASSSSSDDESSAAPPEHADKRARFAPPDN